MAAPVHPANGAAVGVDVGVAKFAALSTGETLDPVSSYAKLQKRPAREAQARPQPMAMGGRYGAHQAAAWKRRIARVRNRFLHEASTDISKTHVMVRAGYWRRPAGISGLQAGEDVKRGGETTGPRSGSRRLVREAKDVGVR